MGRFHHDGCKSFILVYIDLKNHKNKLGTSFSCASKNPDKSGKFPGKDGRFWDPSDFYTVEEAEGCGVWINDANLDIKHAAPLMMPEKEGEGVTRIWWRVKFGGVETDLARRGETLSVDDPLAHRFQGKGQGQFISIKELTCGRCGQQAKCKCHDESF